MNLQALKPGDKVVLLADRAQVRFATVSKVTPAYVFLDDGHKYHRSTGKPVGRSTWPIVNTETEYNESHEKAVLAQKILDVRYAAWQKFPIETLRQIVKLIEATPEKQR